MSPTESETTWVNLLKILFIPGNVTESLRDNFLLYQWLTDIANVVPYGAQDIRFPVKDQRQAGVGFLDTGSASVPTATASNSLIARFGVRWAYGVGELDDMVMKVSRSDTFAYQNARQQVIDDLLMSMKIILNAAWYDDGRCRMGALPAADNQTTVTLLQPIHLMKGFRVDLMDDTDWSTKIVSGRAVTAVDHQGVSTNLLHGTVTIDGAAPAGTAADDAFVPENAIDASGNQRAPFGLRAGCSSQNPQLENYGNLNRSTAGNEAWQGNRINTTTNEAWSARRAQALLQLISRRASGQVQLSDVRFINNRNIAQEIVELVAPDKQIVVTGEEALPVAPGAAKGSEQSFRPFGKFNGINDMFADDMSPANVQFAVSPKSWHITQTNPPELVQDDGSILHTFESRPAMWFRWRFPHEVYTSAPASNGIYEGISETNPLA